jgi:transcriptional regulator GlxA family with amidase domain
MFATDRPLIDIAGEYLERCFAIETAPQVNELARECGMPAYAFSKAFKREVGQRPAGYLKRARLVRAKRLLLMTALPMNAIAYKSGFPTRATFFQLFRRSEHISPNQFRIRALTRLARVQPRPTRGGADR